MVKSLRIALLATILWAGAACSANTGDAAAPNPSPTATPLPQPTATPAPRPTATPTTRPTATPSPTATPLPQPTATPTPAPVAITGTLIQLVDPHDEPEHYCMDVRGVGATLDINAPLTAHTCKPFFDDELFDVHVPGTGQLYMQAYDRCVAANPEAGASLFIVPCSNDDVRNFSFLSDGRIQLNGTSDTPLCIGVGSAAGEPTGGPSHLRRLLLLVSCDEHPASLTTWVVPGPDIA